MEEGSLVPGVNSLTRREGEGGRVKGMWLREAADSVKGRTEGGQGRMILRSPKLIRGEPRLEGGGEVALRDGGMTLESSVISVGTVKERGRESERER